jgi:hypothetical protein
MLGKIGRSIRSIGSRLRRSTSRQSDLQIGSTVENTMHHNHYIDLFQKKLETLDFDPKKYVIKLYRDYMNGDLSEPGSYIDFFYIVKKGTNEIVGVIDSNKFREIKDEIIADHTEIDGKVIENFGTEDLAKYMTVIPEHAVKKWRNSNHRRGGKSLRLKRRKTNKRKSKKQRK